MTSDKTSPDKNINQPIPQATQLIIDNDSSGQRIDNFLLTHCKGIPKSHIYQILRSGQVRVNKGRVSPDYRLALEDQVRIPPLRKGATSQQQAPAKTFPIIYEDTDLLVINKPAGVAVHGGSGISYGVIEQLRQAMPQLRFLELAHRLDRETSGILLLAKRRSALVKIHEQLRHGHIKKRYLACVHGHWAQDTLSVKEPLVKYLTPEGERRVAIAQPNQIDMAQAAHTVFHVKERFDAYTLLEAELKTGRTHQIRVHLIHCGTPILGDDKYGDFVLNRQLAKTGAKPSIKRMFLHAWKLNLTHPLNNTPLALRADLPPECESFLKQLRENS